MCAPITASDGLPARDMKALAVQRQQEQQQEARVQQAQQALGLHKAALAAGAADLGAMSPPAPRSAAQPTPDKGG